MLQEVLEQKRLVKPRPKPRLANCIRVGEDVDLHAGQVCCESLGPPACREELRTRRRQSASHRHPSAGGATVLTFQRVFSRLLLALLGAFHLQILAGRSRSLVRIFIPREEQPSTVLEGAAVPIVTTYLRYLCKLSVSLGALFRCLHGSLVVVHEGTIHSQLAGLQDGTAAQCACVCVCGCLMR